MNTPTTHKIEGAARRMTPLEEVDGLCSGGWSLAAVLFSPVFLLLPLVNVFAQAFAYGWNVLLDGVEDRTPRRRCV